MHVSVSNGSSPAGLTMTMTMKTFINSSKHSNVNVDKNTVALNKR